LNGLGKFTRLGASIMIMGLCGNAIVPLFYGWLADRFDTRHAYWILVPCYLYLIFYAVYGHRVRNRRRRNGERPPAGGQGEWSVVIDFLLAFHRQRNYMANKRLPLITPFLYPQLDHQLNKHESDSFDHCCCHRLLRV
jgi:MFS family permease